MVRRSLHHQMTPRLPQAFQILIDDLAIARWPEAREMAAMHDADRERPDPLERRLIVATVGMIGVVNQGAVIDDVACEEDAGLLLEETDPAR